jgi:glutathione S-transferase
MLELYANTGCQYCQKVMAKMNELGIDFIFRSHSYTDGENARSFMLGGKTQVPFLVDPEKDLQMYESGDIIKYLEENYG